jgi:hypothetical protein
MSNIRAAIILLVLVSLLAACDGFGRPIYGPKVGLNVGSIFGDGFEYEGSRVTIDAGYRTTWCFGGYVEVPLSPRFSFQGEALFSRKGARRGDSDPAVNYKVAAVKMYYLEFPLLLRLNLRRWPKVMPFIIAGPQVSLKTDGEMEVVISGQTFYEEIEDLESTDFGIIVGGGAEFPYEKFNLGLEFRYDHGLKTIYKPNDDADVRTRTFSFVASAGF